MSFNEVLAYSSTLSRAIWRPLQDFEVALVEIVESFDNGFAFPFSCAPRRRFLSFLEARNISAVLEGALEGFWRRPRAHGHGPGSVTDQRPAFPVPAWPAAFSNSTRPRPTSYTRESTALDVAWREREERLASPGRTERSECCTAPTRRHGGQRLPAVAWQCQAAGAGPCWGQQRRTLARCRGGSRAVRHEVIPSELRQAGAAATTTMCSGPVRARSRRPGDAGRMSPATTPYCGMLYYLDSISDCEDSCCARLGAEARPHGACLAGN